MAGFRKRQVLNFESLRWFILTYRFQNQIYQFWNEKWRFILLSIWVWILSGTTLSVPSEKHSGWLLILHWWSLTKASKARYPKQLIDWNHGKKPCKFAGNNHLLSLGRVITAMLGWFSLMHEKFLTRIPKTRDPM